jgi:geranylgeranyl transferase type-2 subunit beta
MKLGYLERLTLQLTIGASALPDQVRDPHSQFILERQQTDGGWSGREGPSDLYYTSFALRSLAILGLLEGAVAERASQFLQSRLSTHQGVVDLLSLVYSARLIHAACSQDPLAGVVAPWRTNVASFLERWRCRDGGYGKIPDAFAGSTYQTFLVALCLELMDQTLPQADKAIAFLQSQRQADGGYREIRSAKRSGTNPTAAAIGALRTLEALDDSLASSAANFLLDLQTDEGGFQANTRMPLPDLLSTFTACVTLWDLEWLDQADLASVEKYVHRMQRDRGGFAGFQLDPAEDVEYTFYGLGTLALIQSGH